jgi:hypothetical protein
LKGVKLLNAGVWPAQSPDMNPVEHMWSHVARGMQVQVFKSRSDLWDAVKTAIESLPPAYIRDLYASMPRRLFAVTGAKGGNTKY